jgi:hypothetical protein
LLLTPDMEDLAYLFPSDNSLIWARNVIVAQSFYSDPEKFSKMATECIAKYATNDRKSLGEQIKGNLPYSEIPGFIDVVYSYSTTIMEKSSGISK